MGFRNISEGTELKEAECIVSRRMRGRGGSIYKITDGDGELEFESAAYFDVGQGLLVSGKVYNDRGFMKLSVSSLEKTDIDYGKFLEKLKAE